EIGVRVVGPDLLEQILESKHVKRCLSRSVDPGSAIITGGPEPQLDAGFWRSIYWPGFGECRRPAEWWSAHSSFEGLGASNANAFQDSAAGRRTRDRRSR